MTCLIHGAAALGRTDKARNADLAVSFIAAQTTLSYFTSGVVKLLGADWRNGRAVERVVRTETYGHEGLYKVLRAHPWMSEALSWSTVFIESTFPILSLHPITRTTALIAMGGFHVANAKVMGLGRFALAFMATYPAIEASCRKWSQR
ncbi:MAG: HTTM domain-containing protein [Kocuria sp.]|nr:HTTM domain-containing protein [Kocuria sp.]